MKKTATILLAALAFSVFCSAEVKLPSVLSDNMVMQRETKVNLWGSATPGKTVKITTSWNNAKYSVRAGNDGKWSVKVATGVAGGPYTITFTEGNTITLDNILLGEVWLCSGQSNMEMPMEGFPTQPVNDASKTLISAGKYSQVRLFHVPRNSTPERQDDCNAKWMVSSFNSAASFSAIGYMYAVRLYDALGIPVGMIESDWGGTRIETWMSKDAAKSVNPKVLDTDAGYVVDKTGYLYNGMICPVNHFTLRGFLWYQGESNKGYDDVYDKNMLAMVTNWRYDWEGGDAMPFYYVQLAPFDYDLPCHQFEGRTDDTLLPRLWEAQYRALKLIPNCDMAANTDLGTDKESLYIHPPYKDVIADRLVMLALYGTYGKATAQVRTPYFESVKYEGGKAIVTFQSETTLFPIDEDIFGFEIAGEDKVFHPANARVMHDLYEFTKSVEVSCPDVPNPVAVRYAYHNCVGKVNLVNTLGLPAYPFRTDNW